MLKMLNFTAKISSTVQKTSLIKDTSKKTKCLDCFVYASRPNMAPCWLQQKQDGNSQNAKIKTSKRDIVNQCLCLNNYIHPYINSVGRTSSVFLHSNVTVLYPSGGRNI